MDTSKEYIKMCEMATEIQKYYNWEDGDYWYNGVNIFICILNLKREPYHPLYTECHGQLTWLPRLDQLQEMVKISGTILLTQVDKKYAMEC